MLIVKWDVMETFQALGPGATVEYTKNTSNVTKEESDKDEAENISSLKGIPLKCCCS